jgi:hypothetical protein
VRRWFLRGLSFRGLSFRGLSFQEAKDFIGSTLCGG